MDSKQQAIGEKRVQQMLIEPLERRGLAKPSSLTKVQFEAMTRDLCARLAYMSEINLGALQEQAAAHPGGKDKDRLPIANDILKWAATIQPPSDDGSPLFRAVFSARLGLDAIRDGWSPELLFDLRKNRRWPGSFVAAGIRDRAGDAVRQFSELNSKMARGDEITDSETSWRSRRLEALEKCCRISQTALQAAE